MYKINDIDVRKGVCRMTLVISQLFCRYGEYVVTGFVNDPPPLIDVRGK